MLAAAAALSPKPLWNSYFLAPLPFAVLALAALWRLTRQLRRVTSLTPSLDIAVAALVVGVLNVPSASFRISQALSTENWEPLLLHYHGVQLSERLREAGAAGRVLSLEGITAIEGNLPIYDRMAAGMFGYRVGDLISESLRERYGILSPANLAVHLDADPPTAIHTTGARPHELELTIIDYARSRGYREIPINISEHRLFIKPNAVLTRRP